jgi:hypothetical protein
MPRLDHPHEQPAVKAAGAIHSDFEKKFIRAEVVNWKALVDHGGYAGVREKGLLRLEGKEYIVKDGDVLVIRHGGGESVIRQAVEKHLAVPLLGDAVIQQHQHAAVRLRLRISRPNPCFSAMAACGIW